jgi:ribonuclease P/MRP protein subunit POP1
VWRGITRYPVSTGGNPRFGGLEQIRQVSYERSVPCFPFDFPGTKAGWEWELQERINREKEWTKRPKGKRVEWTSIDLGRGKTGELGDPWACDWERLLPPVSDDSPEPKKPLDRTGALFQQLLGKDALGLIAKPDTAKDSLKVPQLFTARISMVQRGVPTNCARIYRLPRSDLELRQQWLGLLSKPKSGSGTKSATGRAPASNSKKENLPQHLQTRALAAKLLEPPRHTDGPPKLGDEDYPRVPDEDDLIGFVTTGNYNLADGRPTAIANLALHRVVQCPDTGPGGVEHGNWCIIREAGQTFGRLAKWEAV